MTWHSRGSNGGIVGGAQPQFNLVLGVIVIHNPDFSNASIVINNKELILIDFSGCFLQDHS